jgi:hypothetical protein
MSKQREKVLGFFATLAFLSFIIILWNTVMPPNLCWLSLNNVLLLCIFLPIFYLIGAQPHKEDKTDEKK